MMNGINQGWGMGSGYVWIIGIIILVIVTWLIVKIMNRSNRPHLPIDKSPMDLVKERYARGEISKPEFLEKKKALS